MGRSPWNIDTVLIEYTSAALDNIFARKSVRTYLNKGVEEEKIDLMLRAGMAAPSGKDLRPWEFIVVTKRASLDSMAAALPYAKMLTEARYAIVVCGDSTRSSYWYLDCSAAAQNILSEIMKSDYQVFRFLIIDKIPVSAGNTVLPNPPKKCCYKVPLP